MKVGKREIGDGKPVFVIAEIGVNHEGNFGMAKEMVEAAAEAGCDSAKFQIVVADTLYPPGKREASKGEENFYELFKKAEFTFEQYAELKALAEKKGMVFFASYNDRTGVDYLTKLNAGLYKLASTQMTNIPLVDYTARQKGAMIISTGMSTMEDVDDAVSAARGAGNENFILLHCVSSYPMPPEEANLHIMQTLRDKYKVPVGFSDHSADGLAAVAAVGMGAVAIERHFSLDPKRPSFDHRLSSDPKHLKKVIDDIRQVEKMRGVPDKKVLPSEKNSRHDFRTSLCVTCDVASGTVLKEEHIGGIRPADGVPTRHWKKLVGKKINRAMKQGDYFSWDDVGGKVG